MATAMLKREKYPVDRLREGRDDHFSV